MKTIAISHHFFLSNTDELKSKTEHSARQLQWP